MFDWFRSYFSPFGGLQENSKPLPEPTSKQLREALAYVDPSKLIAGWKITPYNPSWLVSRKGLSVFDQMRKDEQVKAAMFFKKNSVLASGWEVVSPGDEPADWEPTRFVKYVLENLYGGFHNFLLYKVMSSLDYGYFIGERLYADVDEGEWKGKLALQKVNHLKPHYLDFITDPFGVLLGLRQQIANRSALEDLPPGKFVIYSYAKQFENFYGTSDLESAYRPWWSKENTYKWLCICLERYGMPPLFALYNANVYSPTMVEELKKVVKNIQNATLGVLPRGSKDDLEFFSQQLGAQSFSIFLEAMKRFDGDIARSILVPSLLGLTPDENVGSLARSGTHFDSFMQIILNLQQDIAVNAINTQVIPQLCDLNFANIDAYPIFRFLNFKDSERLKIFETWSTMVAGGVVNRVEDDETHIRKNLGFPENDQPEIKPLPSQQKASGETSGPDEGKGKKEEKEEPGAEKKLSDDQFEKFMSELFQAREV